MGSRTSKVAKAVVVLVAFLSVCDFSSADYKTSLKDWKSTAKYMKSEWKKTGKAMKEQYKDGDITKSYLYEMWKEYKPYMKGYLVRRTRRLWHPAPSPTNIHPFPLAGQMPIGGLAQRNSDPPHCSYIKSQLFPHSLPLPPVLLI